MFPIETLESFHEDELEAMLCGVGEKWTVEKLAESIKCDHGWGSIQPCLRAAESNAPPATDMHRLTVLGYFPRGRGQSHACDWHAGTHLRAQPSVTSWR